MQAHEAAVLEDPLESFRGPRKRCGVVVLVFPVVGLQGDKRVGDCGDGASANLSIHRASGCVCLFTFFVVW